MKKDAIIHVAGLMLAVGFALGLWKLLPLVIKTDIAHGIATFTAAVLPTIWILTEQEYLDMDV